MIIALSGKAGAGKDTIANELAKYGFIKLSFADPPKRMAMEMFDFSKEQLWGESSLRDEIDLRYGFSPRHVLQSMATGFGRNLYDDVWINVMNRTIESLQNTVSTYSPYYGVKTIYTPTKHDRLDTNKKLVIADCRFKNEFNFIKSKNWEIFRVKRDSQKDLDHISETDLDDVDDSEFAKVFINNNVEDLKSIVKLING